MRLETSLPFLFACAVFSLIAALPFVGVPDSPGFYRFEVTLRSDQPGVSQLYWDDGDGYAESKSVQQPVPPGRDVRLSFPLPLGRIVALRLDPLNRPARLSVVRACIVTRDGDDIRAIPAQAFSGLHQISTLEASGEALWVVTTPDADDPSLALHMVEPLDLPERSTGKRALACATIVFIILIGMGAGVSMVRMRRPHAWLVETFRPWCAARPLLTIVAVGALASLASCALPLLRGHDLGTGALFAAPRPVGWAHYLDPLNLLLLLSDNASWAWTLRAVLARGLLAGGTGFVVWRLTRHLPTALLIAASTPFTSLIAGSIDRFTAPALGYAPWVLGCALGASEATRGLRSTLWGIGWLLANVFLLSSGSSTAVALAVGLNAVAVLAALSASPPPWRTRLLRAAAFASATLLLVLVVSTLAAVPSLPLPAGDPLAPPAVQQVPPMLIAGLFDHAFQRAFHGDDAINPAANFLILFGLAWLTIRARQAWRDRAVRSLTMGFVVTAAALFGIIPPSRLAALPDAALVPSFDLNAATFLLVLALALAGWGWREAWTRLGRREGLAEGVLVMVVVATVLAGYYGTAQAILRSLEVELAWGIWVRTESWVHAYALSLLVAGAGLMTLVAIAVRRRKWTPAMLVYCATCLYLLHWRHGV